MAPPVRHGVQQIQTKDERLPKGKKSSNRSSQNQYADPQMRHETATSQRLARRKLWFFWSENCPWQVEQKGRVSRSPVFIMNYCGRQLYLKLCGDSSAMILGWEMLIATEQPPVLAEIPGQSAGTWAADVICYNIPDVKKWYSLLFFICWLQMKPKQILVFSF